MNLNKILNTRNIECYITSVNKSLYCIPSKSMKWKDSRIRQTFLKGDLYERDTLKFIKSNYDGGDIIHAGSFFGCFIPFLSKICRGKIWTYEPNPLSFACLYTTVKLNNLSSIEYKNIALSNSKDSKYLKTKKSEVDKDLFETCHISNREKDSINIDTNKVDNLIPEDRNVSIIHLDVEGHEKEVLEGSIQTIKRCKPLIILESIPYEWLKNNLPKYNKITKEKEVHGNTAFKFDA